MYRHWGKRLLDLCLTLAAFLLLLPVMGVIAIIVRLKLGTPVLFRQQRPGLHGEPFTLYKFRTMTDERDKEGNLLPDSRRLTPLGSFLRRSSLDELPELWNVLRGEMSLVGPRPLLMKYMPYYTEHERKRFSMLPGITGWAQIKGRNNLGWDERLALDVWYVENCTLYLDLKILFQTAWKALYGEDVQVSPSSTMMDMDEERKQNA